MFRKKFLREILILIPSHLVWIRKSFRKKSLSYFPSRLVWMRKKSSAATPNSNFNPKLRRLALLEAGQGCGAHRSPNCGKPRRTSHEVYARGWGVKNRGVLGSMVPFFLIPVSQFSNLIRASLNFLKPTEFSSCTTFSASPSGKTISHSSSSVHYVGVVFSFGEFVAPTNPTSCQGMPQNTKC